MKRKWLKLRASCFLLNGLLFFVFQSAQVQGAALAQQEPDSEQSVPLPAETKEGNITVDFKNADIHDVLKIIAYKSRVNIVAGKDVEGKVSIRLVDVPWERALDVILKNSGFVYERDQGIIRVVTLENLGQEELSTQIFVLNYAVAEEIAKAITEMLTERGNIKFDQRTNQLVVTDIPSNLYKVSRVVEKLDAKIIQVMIEARVIKTVLDEDERLGIDWSLYGSIAGSSRPTTVPFVFGTTGGITGKKFFPKVDTCTSDFSGSTETGFPYAAKDNFTFGTLNFTSLQAVLEIFKRRSNTKTLSNPRIITLNNEEAVIHVGKDYNIPLYERNNTTGQMEITDYKTRKVGVKLTVTPHVNAQGEILVDLHPEVSSFYSLDDYGNVKAPVFSISEAKTQVMVKDGETIVIGGLITDEVVDMVKKVPILGDIPLLKYIFSKTEKRVDTTNLIIFVTVRLLDSQGKGLSRQAKVVE